MKNHLFKVVLFLSLLGAWACRPILPVPPGLPAPTPTVTVVPTLVPGCGVSIIFAPNSIHPPIVIGSNPVPVTIAMPVMTPVGTPVGAPVTNLGWPGLIRNLSDWQAAYGSAAPPVNFNLMMLLPITLYQGCTGGNGIQSVCWDDTQVTIFAESWSPLPGAPICNMATIITACLIVVPQTNLPIVTISQYE